MAIDGVSLVRDDRCVYFCIESISDDLKAEIKRQITGIWNGLAEMTSRPSFYNLSNTLNSFIDRYSNKSDKTKKGMIGELLTHIVMNHYMSEFESVSILKNKEERSIKKGFDVIYFEHDTEKVWYAEVKSGEANASTPTHANKALLGVAKRGINTIFESKRISLWESALIDVTLTVETGPRNINIGNLLTAGYDEVVNDISQNVILISVLFHPTPEKIDFSSIVDFKSSLDADASIDIEDSFVISIHKETYTAVESYLTELKEAGDAE